VSLTNEIILGCSIVKSSILSMEEQPQELEDLAKACFAGAMDENCNWYAHTDDERFRIGVGAMILVLQDRDDEVSVAKVERTMKGLSSVSALMAGIPVDLSQLDVDDVVPLLQWFKESQADAS
jgi:hypothetical protein